MINDAIRKKLQGVIHAQCSRIGFSNSEYKNFLSDNFCVTSTMQFLELKEFYAAIDALNEALVLCGLEPMHVNKPYSPLAYAAKKRAERILGPGANRRLTGFLSKIGKSSIDECSNLELRRLHGFLSSVERSQTTGTSSKEQ